MYKVGSKDVKNIIVTLQGLMSSLEKSSTALTETTVQMKQTPSEVERLSQQMGMDQANSRFMLSTLQTYTNKMESLEWQVSGGRRNAAPTLKEIGNSLVEHGKKISQNGDQREKGGPCSE